MLQVRELRASEVTASHASAIAALMTELAGEPRLLSERDLREVARSNHVFVAIAGDHVLGVVCLVPMRLPQGVRLWIESVIVAPDHRGAGLGQRLMEAALLKARDYGDLPISLTSNPARGAAHQLFQKLGFTRADTSVFRRRSAGPT